MLQFQDQNCDGYTRTALMGNWYEDREAIEQKFNLERDFREKRPSDDGCITYPTIHGQLKNLPKIQRAHPWLTKDVIVPNDGFREFRSVTQTQYDMKNIENKRDIKNLNSNVKQQTQKHIYPESNQFSLNVQTHKVEKMLNDTNLHEITQTQRPVAENRTDYGSILNRHGNEYNRFYAMTTNQEFYSRKNKPTVEETNVEKEIKQAGIVERDQMQYGTKQTSVLTGEQFRTKKDPKDNVFVQRTWLYQNDKALQQGQQNLEQVQLMNTQKNLTVNPLQTYKQSTNQVLDHDIGTSLPLKNGVDNLRQKYTNNNEYRHMRTDITIVHNKPLRQK